MIWLSLLPAALLSAVGGTPTSTPTATPATATASSLPLQAPHARARAALHAGDAAGALAALPAEAPAGLRARALRLAGRVDEACALAVGDSAGARWHRLVCAARRAPVGGPVDAAAVAAAVELAGRAPALLVADDERAALTLTLLRGADDAAKGAIAAGLVERPIPPFDRAARARLAGVLAAIVDVAPVVRARAAARLVFELPEHARDADRAAVGDLDAAARVRLATTLERLHDNDGVLAAVKDLVKTDCEAALLVGKAERKRKKYGAARAALKSATAKHCSEELQKKAAYLEARVASVQKGQGAEQLATAFVARWGRDPLVDDVLLWLAEIRTAGGDIDGAAAALTTLVTEHTDGDMADEARFRLAMHHAVAGDAARARALLDETAARFASGKAKVADADRARYWSARLRVAPSPDSWAPGDDVKAGAAALAAFAAERPASFYGRLAALVAARFGAPVPASTMLGYDAVPVDAAVPVPPALQAVPAFRDGLASAAVGFDDDAVILLGDVDVGRGDADVAFALAAAFSSLGRPDLSHRALRDRGFALLPGAPVDAGSLQRFVLDWPRAHEVALREAATAHGVPPLLLMGLSREESAFDEHVVSWAGATGLCQLMPATAADEAKALKLPPPTPALLTEPTYNATLGAAHLGRRLKGLGHPFKAIAAYNAGPGAVLKWMPPSGTALPVDRWVEQIPFDETRNYVKKVTNSWVTYSALSGAPAPTFALEIKTR